MSAVFLRVLAHSVLVALVAASGIAQAQSPRVQPPQQPGSAAARPAPAPAPETTSPRTSRSLDRIVAVVNDEVITANELRNRTTISEAQLRRQKIQLPPREVLERQVLERMIVARAQLQLARETGVRVDDGTVNAAIGRVAESNGMTVPALRQRLEADGLSFNQFREDIRQDIVLNRLREREVDNRVQISDSELDSF
ncbi:MAG: SurA N-terminal domain-containing protein, partial [Burkholderiaceae bacterium]